MNEMFKLVGNNQAMYIGEYGFISSGVYIKKSDPFNNLHSPSNIIYNGEKKGTDELVYIKNPAEPIPARMPLGNCELPAEGMLLLFHEDYIYILNFSSHQYFKYQR